MRVYNSWSREEFVKNHIPCEFQAVATSLTAKQLEVLTESIDAYRSRILRQEKEHVQEVLGIPALEPLANPKEP